MTKRCANICDDSLWRPSKYALSDIRNCRMYFPWARRDSLVRGWSNCNQLRHSVRWHFVFVVVCDFVSVVDSDRGLSMLMIIFHMQRSNVKKFRRLRRDLILFTNCVRCANAGHANRQLKSFLRVSCLQLSNGEQSVVFDAEDGLGDTRHVRGGHGLLHSSVHVVHHHARSARGLRDLSGTYDHRTRR